jgi:hypothetical protein
VSLTAAEQIVQAGPGIIAGFLIDVGANLRRGGYARVAEDHLRVK